MPTCNVYLYRGTDYCYIINVFTKLKKNSPCPIQDGGGGMQPRHDHNIRYIFFGVLGTRFHVIDFRNETLR